LETFTPSEGAATEEDRGWLDSIIRRLPLTAIVLVLALIPMSALMQVQQHRQRRKWPGPESARLVAALFCVGHGLASFAERSRLCQRPPTTPQFPFRTHILARPLKTVRPVLLLLLGRGPRTERQDPLEGVRRGAWLEERSLLESRTGRTQASSAQWCELENPVGHT
jgi:hypothetical protein